MNNPEIIPLKRHDAAFERSHEYDIRQPDGTTLRKRLGEITTDEAMGIERSNLYSPEYVNNPKHPRDKMDNQIYEFLGNGFTNSEVAYHHWEKATDQETGQIDIDILHEEALLEDAGRERINTLLESKADEPELFDYLQGVAQELAYDNENYTAMPLGQLERCLEWAVLLHKNPQAIQDGITPLRLDQEEKYWQPAVEQWQEKLTSYPETVRNFERKDINPADYQMSLRKVVKFCGAERAKYLLTWDNKSPESRNYISEEVTKRFIDEHNELIRDLDHTPRQVIEHTMQWLTHEETDSEGRVSLGLLRIVQKELEQTRKLLTSIQNGTYAEEFAQADEATE